MAFSKSQHFNCSYIEFQYAKLFGWGGQRCKPCIAFGDPFSPNFRKQSF